MRCPKCKNSILQKSGDKTRLRITGRIVFDDDGNCMAQCLWCKSHIKLPIDIRDGTPIRSERFFLPEKIPDKA